MFTFKKIEFGNERKMPDESCRKCGGLLLNYTMCAKCKAAIQFICRICGEKTEVRFHDTICFRKDELPIGVSKNFVLENDLKC